MNRITSDWDKVCRLTMPNPKISSWGTRPCPTVSDHTASGMCTMSKIRSSGRQPISVRWMSGPASATEMFTAPVPTPGLPSSPCAAVRLTPPNQCPRLRQPHRGQSPHAGSGPKYAPVTVAADLSGRPKSLPRPQVCGFHV